MEHHQSETPNETRETEKIENTHGLFRADNIAIVFSLLVIVGAVVYSNGRPPGASGYRSTQNSHVLNDSASSDQLENAVIPPNGVSIPVRWGDLGIQMAEAGVIDRQKFDAVYADRGGIGDDIKALLEQKDNDRLTVTPENSGQILNLLWALGLANRNQILDNGPMQDPRYGGAGGFASTGGWTLADGNAMDHYSRHALVTLTPEQQILVERVAQNIYRPCCGNSTYFPDCNHGMAMLGLLELMASQNISEANMYRAALKVNAYWFPDTYLTIAKYFGQQGVAWDAVDPKEALGENFSSSAGYRRVVSELARPTETITPSRRPSGGCGV